MVSCSCIPRPASLKARKLYNLLVPDVFPLQAPQLEEPINKATQRKFGKLQEYVNLSPSKAGKVSRRLTRRVKKSLYNHQYGYVNIAVHAYAYLLAHSVDEKCSYTFNYFTKELIHQPDALIKTLLNYPKPQIQALGAELLTSYIKAQNEVENQAEANSQLVAIAIKHASGASTAASVPSAMSASEDHELKLACLTSIQEYVIFCQKLKILPQLLEEIETSILTNLEADPQGMEWLSRHTTEDHITPPAVTKDVAAGGAKEPLGGPAHPAASLDRDRDNSRTSGKVGSLAGLSHTTTALAVSILLKFRPFLRDISTVHRVLDTLLRHLDQGSRWRNDSLVQGLMRLVREACGDHTFPLFTALVRHCSAPGLTVQQRCTIVRLALQQGAVYSLSAFGLCLTELPRALAGAGIAPPADTASEAPDSQPAPPNHATSASTVPAGTDPAHELLWGAVKDAICSLSRDVGDAGQLCEAMGSSLRSHAQPSEVSRELLRCCLTAVQTIHSFSDMGRTFPSKSLPGTLLQQLYVIFTTWPDTSQQRLALYILAELLHWVGRPLRDERQAELLLALCHTIATAERSTPSDFELCSKLTSAALSSVKPAVSVSAAQLGAALREHMAGAKDAVRQCAVLLLLNSVIGQLGACINCPALASFQVQDPAPSTKALHMDPSTHTITCTAQDWPSSSADIAAASAFIQSVAVMQLLGSGWKEQWLDVLSSQSSLSSALSSPDALKLQLQQEFAGPPVVTASTATAVGGVAITSRGLAGITAANGSLQPDHRSHPNKGVQLAKLVAAQPWAVRSASIKHARLNLSHVMDLLASEDTGSNSSATGAAQQAGSAGATHGSMSDLSGVPGNGVVSSSVQLVVGMADGRAGAAAGQGPDGCVSVQDVLKLVSEMPGQGRQLSKVAGLHRVQVSALASQLEPVVH